MTKEKQIEEITQYYVLRNKDTGMYFRGKGVNRWGKYFNQATIYRVRGTAEASAREVAWHGEKVEIVPIQIFENEAGYRKQSEIVRCKDCEYAYMDGDRAYCRNIQTPWYNDYFEVFTKANDFCSYAKMKGGERDCETFEHKQSEGEWITKGDELKNTTCSVCNYWVETPYGKTPYCPNCGARMKGGAE